MFHPDIHMDPADRFVDTFLHAPQDTLLLRQSFVFPPKYRSSAGRSSARLYLSRYRSPAQRQGRHSSRVGTSRGHADLAYHLPSPGHRNRRRRPTPLRGLVEGLAPQYSISVCDRLNVVGGAKVFGTHRLSVPFIVYAP